MTKRMASTRAQLEREQIEQMERSETFDNVVIFGGCCILFAVIVGVKWRAVFDFVNQVLRVL